MFKLLRIDNRLVHGQVAFSIVSAYKIKKIIVANTKYATTPMLKMTLQIGKPSGVKMDIFKLEDAINYINTTTDNLEETLVVTIDPKDAEKLVLDTKYTGDVCLGGVVDGEGKKFVHSQVFLSQDEIDSIKKMVEAGANVYAQDVPSNKSLSAKDIIESY